MYLQRGSLATTLEEDTSVDIRITLSRPTAKAMHGRLQQAYARGDVRLLRRISVLLEYLQGHVPLQTLRERWGISEASVYVWLKALLLHGVASLVYAHGGGRPAKLTPTQKKQLCAWLDKGSQTHGFESACWTTRLIQELIRREFGVLYNRFYLCELLRNLGYSFQKAQYVSDHLDPDCRERWKTQHWPQILAEARRRGALILFGDEAYFPQWGSLSYTWAKRGQTPKVKTAGKRKAYKLFGLIEFFSGRFFHQSLEGKFTSAAYQAFLLSVLAQTSEHLFLIQDGARYHTSKAMQLFFAQQQARLTVCPLPSYSPDYNPIEYLWRNLKKRTTHNKYFAQFTELIAAVDSGLTLLTQQPTEVLRVFGLYCAKFGLPVPNSA
jgi:transposase